MKPLTAGQKKFIDERLVFGPPHRLARPLYDLVIGCEAAVERGKDLLAGRRPATPIAGLPVLLEKVPTLFIGRTGRVREVGWNLQLKRRDHADFFSRAWGLLTTVLDERWKVLHTKTPFNRGCMRMKLDNARDRTILHARFRHKGADPR
ncbi:MAG: hypothetical protein WB783_19300 [Arenicellales bacterium]